MYGSCVYISSAPSITAKLSPSHNASIVEGMTDFYLTCCVIGAEELKSPDIKFAWKKDDYELPSEMISGIQSHR